MERNQFFMETNSYCFLCLNNPPGEPVIDGGEGSAAGAESSSGTSTSGGGSNNQSNGEAEPKLETVSFQRIFKYLKVDLNRVFRETIHFIHKHSPNMDKWELKGKFCADCIKLVKQCSTYLLALRDIQMKVDTCISSMYEKLLGGQKDEAKVDAFWKDMSNCQLSLLQCSFVERVRHDTLDKFAEILGKPKPKRPRKRTFWKPLQSNVDIFEIKREMAEAPEVITLEEEPKQIPLPPSPQRLVISSVRGSVEAEPVGRRSRGTKNSSSSGNGRDLNGKSNQPQPSTSRCFTTVVDLVPSFSAMPSDPLEVVDSTLDLDVVEDSHVEREEEEVMTVDTDPANVFQIENVFTEYDEASDMVSLLSEPDPERDGDTFQETKVFGESASTSRLAIPLRSPIRRISTGGRGYRLPTLSTSSPNNHGYGLRRKRFRCTFCSRKFKIPQELEVHRKRFHANNNYRCVMCPKAFKTSQGLLVHNKKKHVKKQRDETPPPSSTGRQGPAPQMASTSAAAAASSSSTLETARPGNADCDVCHNSFSSRQYMLEHRKSHFGEKWRCDQCLKQFASRSNYYTHRRNVHNIRRDNSLTPQQPTNRSLPVVIRRLGSPVKPPSRNMNQKSEQQLQQRQNNEGSDFIIPMNGSGSTPRPKQRKRQSPAQAGSSSFASNGNGMRLVDDFVCQDGIYYCSQCDKGFGSLSNLKRHFSLVHVPRKTDDQLKYRCEICDKGFGQSQQLKFHREGAHFGKRYKCRFCPKDFAQPSSVRQHERESCPDRR